MNNFKVSLATSWCMLCYKKFYYFESCSVLYSICIGIWQKFHEARMIKLGYSRVFNGGSKLLFNNANVKLSVTVPGTSRYSTGTGTVSGETSNLRESADAKVEEQEHSSMANVQRPQLLGNLDAGNVKDRISKGDEFMKLVFKGVFDPVPEIKENFEVKKKEESGKEEDKASTSEALVIGHFADPLNFTKSLPYYHLLKSKANILNEVYEEKLDDFTKYQLRLTENNNNSKENEDKFKISVVQKFKLHSIVYYRLFFKIYLNFFKFGIKNVWNNFFIVKREVKDKYYLLDNGLGFNDLATGAFKDKKIKIKDSNLDLLIDILSNSIRCIENETSVKDGLEYINSKSDLISISRSKFQALLRSKNDFKKIPIFGGLFLIFEEITILFCYIFPSITPTTCIVPQLMKRSYHRQISSESQLIEQRKDGESELTDISKLNPYSITDSKELKLISKYLNIHSISIIDNDNNLRKSMINKYKEILVDNYLILRDGGVSKLNKLELIFCCINRGLINYNNLIETVNDKNTDRLNFIDKFDEIDLRIKLMRFIYESNDKRNNIGLIGVYSTTTERNKL